MIMMAVVNALVVSTTLNDYDNDKENLGRMVVVVFVGLVLVAKQE